MKIQVVRYLLEKEYTMGKLYIDDTFICDTLEDTYRGQDLNGTKVYGQTCIPCGTYKVAMTMSNRFKTVLPEILDVPFFTGIRIHNGNVAEQTDGCILVGKKEKDGFVGNSKATLKYLVNALSLVKDIELEIKVGYY